jgi:hypothetical protein
VKSIVENSDVHLKRELFSTDHGESMLDIYCTHEIELKANNVNYPFKHKDVLICFYYYLNFYSLKM